MRVLLAEWAPFYAGAEVAAERLAVGLRGAGHDVLVVCGTDGEALARAREAGLRTALAPMTTTDKWTFWRTLRMRRDLDRLLREERPDVVHANDLPTAQMVGPAALRAGVPRVAHHRWAFDAPAVEWLNKHGAERHVFVSEYLRGDLTGKSPALAAAPTAVVHDGLPLGVAPSDDDRLEARRELGLRADALVVLFAGQLVERKGIADTLHAWPAVAARRPDAELHVVGDDLQGAGAYRRAMERLAAELGARATFHGFRRDVPCWLAACDLVLVPSHVEPLGNATLEAMSAGRPVVATRVGGIPEMVVDGATGLLVPPRDPVRLAEAVTRLVLSQGERRAMGLMGRQCCEERFSIVAHVRAMLSQYEAAIAARGADAA